jgi:hypothetical protein
MNVLIGKRKDLDIPGPAGIDPTGT